MEPPHHGLRTGVEVDYNVVDSYWIPARVEDTRTTATEEVVCVRFTIGAVDVLHVLDLRVRSHRARLAPLGMHTYSFSECTTCTFGSLYFLNGMDAPLSLPC
jgi:hypothetical protein